MNIVSPGIRSINVTLALLLSAYQPHPRLTYLFWVPLLYREEPLLSELQYFSEITRSTKPFPVWLHFHIFK